MCKHYNISRLNYEFNFSRCVNGSCMRFVTSVLSWSVLCFSVSVTVCVRNSFICSEWGTIGWHLQYRPDRGGERTSNQSSTTFCIQLCEIGMECCAHTYSPEGKRWRKLVFAGDVWLSRAVLCGWIMGCDCYVYLLIFYLIAVLVARACAHAWACRPSLLFMWVCVYAFGHN